MSLCIFNDEIVANRNKYDKVVHLVGDSISRGYALGVFADGVPSNHPYYILRSIPSMANSVLANSNSPHRLCYMSGTDVRARFRDGVIRSGDVVIFEDAGEHGSDPVAYKQMIANLRAAITDKHNVTAVFMSMFDYYPVPNFQYDTPFNGKTINQATYEAATEDTNHVGQTLFLDMNSLMDGWKASSEGQQGVPIILDGIHPNVWGQMFMTGEYLKIAGLRPYLTNASDLYNVIYANWQTFAYGSPYFTQNRAIEYANFCIYR